MNGSDTVISVVPRHGDIRHIAGRAYVPKELWRLHPLADASVRVPGSSAAFDGDRQLDARYGLKAHSLMFSNPYGSSDSPPGGASTERLGLGGALGATFLSDFDDAQFNGVLPSDFVEDERSYACLLYTSPSPRDLSTSRMPSSA